MKRLIDHYLVSWKNSKYRKPLLLRGARQIGKTYAARILGKQFDHFVEVNFESNSIYGTLFDQDLDPKRIIKSLSLITGQPIIPQKTLLFFDEIQNTPNALTALRYFYEKLPELHVIAAGSLLDFTTQMIGIPVGRVSSFYLYPLSFFEFLCACGHTLLAQELLHDPIGISQEEALHKKLFSFMGEYLAIGGMPEAVERWKNDRDPLACLEAQQSLIDTYRQDFGTYAKEHQLKYLEIIFKAIPRQLGSKFKYSAIEGDYRKRELAPCLELLTTAGIVHQVTRTAGNGVPLGAEADPQDFKIIFLDIGLTQKMLGLDLKSWLLQPEESFINKGSITEAFVGQELLAYTHPTEKAELYYWRRNTPGSEAEVDYLIQSQNKVIPIEVKSGTGKTLASMHLFLKNHPLSPYGIKLSTQPYSTYNAIRSYPLYALANLIIDTQGQYKALYENLTQQ